MHLPKIYLFFNNTGSGDGSAYAISEDGKVLGTHICSNEAFVPGDLNYRDKYSEYYPNGYELEFVRVRDLKNHIGLNTALKIYDNSSTKKPIEPTISYDLLVIPPQTTPIYIVVKNEYTHGNYNKQFFYESHSCPINWLRNIEMIAIDGDMDPHGLIKYIDTKLSTDAINNEYDDTQVDWIKTFPQIGSNNK